MYQSCSKSCTWLDRPPRPTLQSVDGSSRSMVGKSDRSAASAPSDIYFTTRFELYSMLYFAAGSADVHTIGSGYQNDSQTACRSAHPLQRPESFAKCEGSRSQPFSSCSASQQLMSVLMHNKLIPWTCRWS